MKKSKESGSSLSDKQLTTLRSYAQWRILKDMIDMAKKNCSCSKDFLVMIVDA